MNLFDRLLGKRFNGYGLMPIPNSLDPIVESVITGYREASPEARSDMIGQVKPDSAAVLSVYGLRMAAVAVRTGAVAPLHSGLTAIALAETRIADRRENLIVLSSINHAAETIGVNPASLVGDLRILFPENIIAGLSRFFARDERGKSLKAMGLRAVGEGDEFRYA